MNISLLSLIYNKNESHLATLTTWTHFSVLRSQTLILPVSSPVTIKLVLSTSETQVTRDEWPFN